MILKRALSDRATVPYVEHGSGHRHGLIHHLLQIDVTRRKRPEPGERTMLCQPASELLFIADAVGDIGADTGHVARTIRTDADPAGRLDPQIPRTGPGRGAIDGATDGAIGRAGPGRGAYRIIADTTLADPAALPPCLIML